MRLSVCLVAGVFASSLLACRLLNNELELGLDQLGYSCGLGGKAYFATVFCRSGAPPFLKCSGWTVALYCKAYAVSGKNAQ